MGTHSVSGKVQKPGFLSHRALQFLNARETTGISTDDNNISNVLYKVTKHIMGIPVIVVSAS